jgi:hypothetical protein
VVENEIQETAGQKRRARRTGMSSASKEMVAAGGTRRSKRVKVAPTRYAPVVEEESLEALPLNSSAGVLIRNTSTLAASPLDESSATADGEITPMNGSNEDVNIRSSRRVSAVAAATISNKRSKGHKTFDERIKDLMSFKAEFGHCNVPQTKSKNNKHLSLGYWCGDMRKAYKAIKEGRSTDRKLSKANIQRLENAGFEWNVSKKVPFDERLKDLMSFKAEFGHCNVSNTRSRNIKYYSLGIWCNNMRMSYKAIKEGESLSRKLSKADIQRLENAGFEWNVSKKGPAFDERLKDLMLFKAEFGHCNVPQTRSRNNKYCSLGIWGKHARQSYKAIKLKRSPSRKLSKANMKRLENAGFEWNISKKVPFDERFKDLMSFKAEFGHCNVPQTIPRNNKYWSLGKWCDNARQSYKAMKEGSSPGCKLTKANIQRLENAGFEWNVSKRVPFDERLKDLMAFKAEFGHCNVPGTQSRKNKHSSLGFWCSNF